MNTNSSGARNLSVGASVGELRVTPSRTQLFMFSAITWNRHQIHFDGKQAAAEGFPDVAVQRGLLGNFLARFMTNFAGPTGRLERLQWKVIRSTFPERELSFQGEITAASASGASRRVSCALKILNPEGEQVAEGSAEVHFPMHESER